MESMFDLMEEGTEEMKRESFSSSPNSSIPDTVIKFDESFGYDCKKFYNLAVLNGEVLVYVTGCYLHFYNVVTGIKTYKHSWSEDGVGAIATHPKFSHLAVGERGDNPDIFILDWHSMKVIHRLQRGTKKGFSHLNYSHDGVLFASQGSAPDFYITIWDWEREAVILRARSADKEVYYVGFSAFQPDQLITCGMDHIKFWKMSETFTGLKLKGKLGKFGKTKACDIIGAVALPNGSVASSSEWGSILIWESNIIQMQVYRTGFIPCHDGPITQLCFQNSILITAGLDGVIRLWNYETIEIADPTEDAPYVEMEPLFTFVLKDENVTSELLSLVKATSDLSDLRWVCQDGFGSVWSLEGSTSLNAKQPLSEFRTHAGAVICVQAGPTDHLLATLGADGRLLIHNYVEKKLMTWKSFNSSGTAMLWLPVEIDNAGKVIVCGFSDGVVRTIRLVSSKIQVIQSIKPHRSDVTCLLTFKTGKNENMLISGSTDGSIFFFEFLSSKSLELRPIGFSTVGASVSSLSCIYSPSLIILVTCENGFLFVYNIPPAIETKERTSFLLDLTPSSIDIGTTISNADESETSNRTVDIETVPNKSSCKIKHLWTSPDALLYFSSFKDFLTLFVFDLKSNEIVKRFDRFSDKFGVPTTCTMWAQKNYLLLGSNKGKIMILRIDSDVSDWRLYGVHDSNRGAVRQICCSADGANTFSCGDDGAVFSFDVTGVTRAQFDFAQEDIIFPEISFDAEDAGASSLEEAKIKENLETKIELAERNKKETLEAISMLESEYKSILAANERLPKEVQLSPEELLVDERVVEDLKRSLFEKNDVYRKLARDIERSELWLKKVRKYFLDDLENLTVRVNGIECNSFVETFRLVRLDDIFENIRNIVRKKLEEIEIKGRLESTLKLPEPIDEPPIATVSPLEGLLKQVDLSKNMQLTRLFRQYSTRRTAAEQRAAAWNDILKRQPDITRSDPEELHLMELARECLGDHKLKTSPDYKVPKHLQVSTISKYSSLLEVRLRIQNIKKNFNQKVLGLRDQKQNLTVKHKSLREILKTIENYIPTNEIKAPPELPIVNEDLEYPEKKFTFSEDDVYKELPNTYKKRNSLGEKSEPSPGISTEFQEDLLFFAPKDEEQNLCEVEMREYIVQQKIEEQNKILTEMTNDISDFDRNLNELAEEKINLKVDLKFLELHLLTLHREVLVLKKFEEEEETKTELAFKKLQEKELTQRNINELSIDIELKNREIQRTEEDILVLVQTYMSTISENKYCEFLKKIFKKKYKPPKLRTDDSDESSESDSETDEDDDDEKSIDSQIIDVDKLNENICPEGCEKDLYDQTFIKRALRHDMENIVAEKKKDIDQLKKQCDTLTKKMKIINEEFDKAQQSLEEFQRKKQENLNEIETVAVLRLSQFQNFKEEGVLEELSESLVMGAAELSKLYNRVGELMKETKQQREKHVLNRQHLQRMSIDIRFMNKVIARKESEIELAMIRKFGAKIDINELEECLLRKMITEIGFVPQKFEDELNKELSKLKAKLKEKKDLYATRLEQNTERLNILTILKEEKRKIELILQRQDLKKETIVSDDDFTDIQQLEDIVKRQEQKLAQMRAEIQNLRYKHCPHEYSDDFARAPQDMLERTLAQKCDEEEIHGVTQTMREQLESICEEMEEIFNDIDSGFSTTQEATIRLKFLVNEFLMKLPENILTILMEQVGEDTVVASDDDLQPILKIAKAAVQLTASLIPKSDDRNAVDHQYD